MANVRKVNRPRPWLVEYRTPDGEKHSQSFKKKHDADAFAAEKETARNRNELLDPAGGKILLRDWSERWVSIAGRDWKPKYVASIRSLLDSRVLPTFGPSPLCTIWEDDVDEWVAGMRAEGLSASRIRQAHFVLSSMLNLAVRSRKVTRNVARGADLPELRRKEAPYFDTTTVNMIVAATTERYRPFVAVQGILGLRFGEAAALRRRSVDLLHRRLRISESLAEIGGELIFGTTKSHAERAVPIPPSLREQLESHLEAHVGPEPDALCSHRRTGSRCATRGSARPSGFRCSHRSGSHPWGCTLSDTPQPRG